MTLSAAARIETVCLLARAMRALARLALMLALLCGGLRPVQAQGVEVLELVASRDHDGVTLDYQVRATLTRAVEDALQRGLPLYFEADARVYRSRWYWRDERVARARQVWRLSYQPLTSGWRVSQGGLHQSHPSLAAALTSISRRANWKVADRSQLEDDERYYVEFVWRLDTAQLPRPMQIGIEGQDWSLHVERTLRLE